MALSGIGCGNRESLYSVRATATLDGNPLSEGVIYFYPVEGGTPEGGHFTDGVLNFKASAGRKRVEIRSYRKNPAPPPARLRGMDLSQYDTRIQIVPRKYNRDSRLTAEVTPEGPNEFTFDLRSK